MLIPPSRKERHLYMPAWAIAAADAPRVPIVAGMRVYCVLYGTMYGDPHGTVEWVSDDGSFCKIVRGVRSWRICATYYVVPLPPEYDPMATGPHD